MYAFLYPGAYVSLSNLCAAVGDWEEIFKIQCLMSGVGVKEGTRVEFCVKNCISMSVAVFFSQD